jgi:hypothetical protein
MSVWFAGALGLLTCQLLLACSEEPSSIESSEADEIADDDSSLSGVMTATPEERESEDALMAQDGCSIVQWCNAPDTGRTRCLKRGCSCAAANAECAQEAVRVCGSPRYPIEMPC